MKALFITHSIDNYGASRSLQLLLNNYKDVQIDLLVGARLTLKSNLYNVRSVFGSHICRIFWCFLPLDYCYDAPYLSPLAIFLKNLLWRINARRIYSIIKNGNYAYIYLNSLGLHQMVSQDYPFLIHVREILKSDKNKASDSLAKAQGVIFIDEATKRPFKDIILKNSIVLNNPFDMSAIKQDFQVRLKRDIDYKNKAIFSILAEHQPVKGTDFVIESFVEVLNDKALLLIVGKIRKGYSEICEAAARADKRVIFYGEEPDIINIYAISDYIIRGEAYNCIGRTIFEGLYSGCHVIVPGRIEDKNNFFEYERFKDCINFYTPREREELKNLFRMLGSKKSKDKTGSSNVKDYVPQFHKFAVNAIKDFL